MKNLQETDIRLITLIRVWCPICKDRTLHEAGLVIKDPNHKVKICICCNTISDR